MYLPIKSFCLRKISGMLKYKLAIVAVLSFSSIFVLTYLDSDKRMVIADDIKYFIFDIASIIEPNSLTLDSIIIAEPNSLTLDNIIIAEPNSLTLDTVIIAIPDSLTSDTIILAESESLTVDTTRIIESDSLTLDRSNFTEPEIFTLNSALNLTETVEFKRDVISNIHSIRAVVSQEANAEQLLKLKGQVTYLLNKIDEYEYTINGYEGDQGKYEDEISEFRNEISKYKNEHSLISTNLDESKEINKKLELSVKSFHTGALYLFDKYKDLAYAFNLEGSKVVPLSQNIISGKVKLNTSLLLSQAIPLGPVLNSTARITSKYGRRNIEGHNNASKDHKGIDFALKIGTEIYAPSNAIVSLVRPSTSKEGSGNYIQLDHSIGFTSSYSHLSKFFVKQGQIIRKGDLIGLSGNSGRSTGPHLHYEIKHNKRHVDPLPMYLFEPGGDVSALRIVDGVDWDSLLSTYADTSLVSAVIYRL